MTDPTASAPNDQLSKLSIVLPKLLGSLAGAIVGVLASMLSKNLNVNIDPPTQSVLTQFLTVLFTFLGYTLTSLVTTAHTNPANVASPAAVIPTVAAGGANVTTDPTPAPAKGPQNAT